MLKDQNRSRRTHLVFFNATSFENVTVKLAISDFN